MADVNMAIAIPFALIFSLAMGVQTQGQQVDTVLASQFTQGLNEYDQAQGMQKDHPDRSRQLFRSAAQRFASIAATGIRNGRLEYNLGNCYLQAGDVGRAILHYRRAERLIPGDPMLADNLAVARSRRLTAVNDTRRSTILRSVFFWHYHTSTSSRLFVAMLMYCAFWATLIVRSFLPSRGLSIAAWVMAIVAVSAGVSLAVDHWGDRNAPEGVVVDMDVVVTKGPGAGYQRVFEEPLQPGVEFTLRTRTASGWWNIELADAKAGWIEARHAELVPQGVADSTALR